MRTVIFTDVDKLQMGATALREAARLDSGCYLLSRRGAWCAAKQPSGLSILCWTQGVEGRTGETPVHFLTAAFSLIALVCLTMPQREHRLSSSESPTCAGMTQRCRRGAWC